MSVPVPSYDEVKSSSQNNTKDEIMDESMGHKEEDPNKGRKSSSGKRRVNSKCYNSGWLMEPDLYNWLEITNIKSCKSVSINVLILQRSNYNDRSEVFISKRRKEFSLFTFQHVRRTYSLFPF